MMDERISQKIKEISGLLKLQPSDVENFLNIGSMILFKESIYSRAEVLSKYDDEVIEKELLSLLTLGVLKLSANLSSDKPDSEQ